MLTSTYTKCITIRPNQYSLQVIRLRHGGSVLGIAGSNNSTGLWRTPTCINLLLFGLNTLIWS